MCFDSQQKRHLGGISETELFVIAADGGSAIGTGCVTLSGMMIAANEVRFLNASVSF